ncbi:solute carrier family 23 protein [Pelagicoccus sp. SDUM812003]|uniref:uracil-xanthine permease family protein n=1 Tax=Pelagicoccus sp. SDUM812003 TaxID=3041267 RepID=UPI0028103DE5|nr:solute carrier family 23 protein [Pelagicoccus sp. SDUM812003]MDQ8205474.1 solute carrier family 23 protein [Pelagicoccus sp. SDUM812003]
MPAPKALLAGFQQVIAMFVGCITPVLIFCSVVDVSDADQRYMISMALFASGVGTFLQAKRFGMIGSGLLSVNGTSFAYVDLLLRAGSEGGVPLACGMALAAVPVQFALAFFLPKLRSIISPLVAGIVVLIIGLDLIPVAGYYIAGDLGEGISWSVNASIASLVVLALLLSQLSAKPLLRMSAPIIAILAGYALSAALGIIQWPATDSEQWIVLPQALPFGLDFKWELLLPFAIIYIVSSIEAIGDLSATASLSGLKTHGSDFWKRVRGGILSDAITSAFASLLNVFPTATFSQNNGVIQLTGVGSRKVGFYVSGILILTALLPQTGYLFSIMPSPVLGGVTLVLFGMIATAGFRMIVGAGLDNSAMLILAISLGLAFSIPSQEDFVASLPEFLSAIFSSKVATGGLTAMIMTLALASTRKLRAAS